METKNKKQTAETEKVDGTQPKKRKSKTTLWWEKNPNGILRIVDMKAVLK